MMRTRFRPGDSAREGKVSCRGSSARVRLRRVLRGTAWKAFAHLHSRVLGYARNQVV